MSAGAVMFKPSPAYLAAFTEIMRRIEKGLGPGKLNRRLVACVAGGAALHFYTGTRVTKDIDASLNARVLLPRDLSVSYRDIDGSPRLLYFDTQYNDTLALMHPDAAEDALPLTLEGVDGTRLEVRLLSPVDLAVSKLSRYSSQDRADILELAKMGLITASALRKRAGDALPDYVGNLDPVRTSIELACRAIESAAPKAAAAAPRTGKPRSRRKR
jgi:hypothetical protein